MFTIVFPCHIKHINKILLPIKSFLKSENHLINQIIIIFNGIDNIDMTDIIQKISVEINKYNIVFNYKIFKEQLNPGIARNKSHDMILSDYIIFHDSDDEPHPLKLTIIRDIFLETKADQVYHLFQPINLSFLDYSKKIGNIDYCIVDNNEYKSCNNLVLTNKSIGPVSHGLISIKKDKLLNIDWSNKRTGEDRDFALKSIKNNNKLVIIKAFLSKYDKYRVSKFKRKFNKYYKLF